LPPPRHTRPAASSYQPVVFRNPLLWCPSFKAETCLSATIIFLIGMLWKSFCIAYFSINFSSIHRSVQPF
jgi:hypothetical protein